MDQLVIGRRIRHARKGAGLTLQALGERAGILPSQLSMIENGRRETRLSTLGRIAGALGVDVTHLLAADAPDARSALEIELDRAQRSSLYGGLGLPAVPASRALPQETLEALVGLHRELARRERESIATPEEARRANTEQRLIMRQQDNHIPAIEELAGRLLADVGHRSGALSHRSVSRMAEGLGFELIYVDDLPRSTRSVTDIGEGRIYLPPASIPGGHGLRSMALQAMAHRVLGHEEPASYADFLRQRLEINYFAAACLMPLTQSVEFLSEAKSRRDLAGGLP